MTNTPSRSAILQARLAAGLLLGLIVAGALWYVPYLLLRGPMERVARRWVAGSAEGGR